MKLFALSTILSITSAIAIDLTERNTPLNVRLEVVGNTAVKAWITNTGGASLKLFKTGSILDDSEVEKVKVFQKESQIPFSGLRLYVSTTGLDDSAFQTIVAGETVQKEFDIAKAHDVSIGGMFEIVSNGAMSYADNDSTELIGIVPFSSNVISTEVDGVQAATTRNSYLSKVKRTAVQSDCTGTQKASLLAALPICATRASAAAIAAQSNSAKITEFFKQDTATVRSTVAGVFNKIAAECANGTAGVSKQYCSDIGRSCGGGVIAYTDPMQSYIVSCPGYFSQMVDRSKTCHGDDKPFVTLHEMTHLRQIKGTDDYGVYGYAAVKRLTAAQNLNHADTYALFASAIETGGTC